jgi:hypothetical protein
VPRPVFLVGSMPYEPEEAFALADSKLRGLVKRLPDGQLHGWLPGQDFATARGLVRGNDDSLQGAPITTTYRPAPGVSPEDVEFETLHYFPAAQHCYAIFRRLRDEGTIDAGVRYQISLPTPFTAAIYFDWDVMRALWPVLERAMFRELDRILDAIPHDDLAISWDVVEFAVALVNPNRRETFTFEELTAAVARCLDAVPEDVEAGLHLCYGGYNSNGVEAGPTRRELPDTGLMVRFAAAVADQAERRVDWVHMPVPRPRDDDGYFAPLEGFRADPETELYLGLVHNDEDVETTRRKVVAAARHAPRFGVAAACGLGEFVSGIPKAETPHALAYHRQIAELEEA